MEFYKYVAVWISYNIAYGSNALISECSKNQTDCVCTKYDYLTEFVCPDEELSKFRLQVHTQFDVIKISCFNNFSWDKENVPLLQIRNVDRFKFSKCSFPTNFAELMNKLQVNNIKEIWFERSKYLANITLTADYFKNLHMHNLEKLKLTYNNIENIDKDAFLSLDKIIELNLDGNNIQLTNGIFKDVSMLKSLSLAKNNLSDIPSEIFQSLTKLQLLSLSGNSLTRINSSIFTNLRSLKTLYLGSNQLESLPENVFYYLKNLAMIDLSSNKLQSISEHLFKNNKLLTNVSMKMNKNLTYLPNHLFSNLTQLQKISLFKCNLIELPNNLFEGLINLQEIDLESNRIEYIQGNIFNGLENLQTLTLSHNKIRNLPKGVFFSLTHLKDLNLQNNLLTSITSEHFGNLRSLELLNLDSNNISFIEPASFQKISKLKEIMLSNNNFDLPKDVALFISHTNLQKVYLGGNRITVMGNFTTLTNLEKLDLSNNQISVLNFNDVLRINSSVYINLKHNNIITVHLTETEVITKIEKKITVSLNENPIKCNCYLSNFVRYIRYIKDSENSNLKIEETNNLNCLLPNGLNVSLIKLDPNMLTCSLQEYGINGTFTNKCSSRIRPSDKSLIINCTNKNFTEAPTLILPQGNFFNQTEILLQGNLLTSGPKEGMGYESATKLSLSSNNISKITWIPPKLKVLELDNNNINYLNDEIVTKLKSSSLTNIALGKNPWNCDCSTVSLVSYLKSKLEQVNLDNITCRDGEKMLVNLNSKDICPSNTPLILGLGITFALIALIIALLVAIYYRFQQKIKVWLFAHNMFLWFVTEKEIDKHKLYDAFISFSHKDEEFVLKELLPVLEQGPKPYKICLHIRDWIAGELISKQIITSVTESRRTMVILSHHFLDSEWGKMEFREAHKQAIHEGRARVILILYGNIDVNSDLDDELKAYVKTNTYVKWGDPWFWDKLRYALPHSRINMEKHSQKTKNVAVGGCENKDDKLGLINGTLQATSKPESTPPVDSLQMNNNNNNRFIFAPTETRISII